MTRRGGPVGLPKPDTCRGCPLYGDGYGYVPDEIVEGSRVAIIAQAPGETEERDGWPLVGQTGDTMMREYFPQGQLTRGEVHVMNVLKCRWQPQPGGPKTNNLPPKAILDAAATQCLERHHRLPDGVEVVLTMGQLASQWMGCPGRVTDWRGAIWTR